jgi:hypothetical protein
MSGAGESETPNHVRSDGGFPRKRSPGAGDGCTAGHCQPGSQLAAPWGEKLRKRIARWARPAILETVIGSAGMNAFAFAADTATGWMTSAVITLVPSRRSSMRPLLRLQFPLIEPDVQASSSPTRPHASRAAHLRLPVHFRGGQNGPVR